MAKEKTLKVIGFAGLFVILFIVILYVLSFFISDGFRDNKVALIGITGAILNSRGIIEEIHSYKEDDSVRAIVLRIDSPGGVVAPAQEIYRELTKVDKIIVVSMGSMAASGGYYIACASDCIFANPGTITGSIGVIMRFPNIQELIKKIGVEREVVKSGNYKDSGSLYRKLTPEEKELFQETIDDVYDQFINVVLEGRKHKKLTREEIIEMADGRIMSGRQALEKKLVDELGNLDDAIDHAGKISGIEGKPKVVKKKVRRSLLERLFDNFLGSKLDQIVDEQVGLRYELPL